MRKGIIGWSSFEWPKDGDTGTELQTWLTNYRGNLASRSNSEFLTDTMRLWSPLQIGVFVSVTLLFESPDFIW